MHYVKFRTSAEMAGTAWIATRMLAVLRAAFMASQFFRVSNAVIAPELMRTLSISSEAMGVITGAGRLERGQGAGPDSRLPSPGLPDMLSSAPARALARIRIVAAGIPAR